MAHELSSENLRRFVPWVKRSGANGERQLPVIEQECDGRLVLRLGPLRKGKRLIAAGSEVWCRCNRTILVSLPLGTISTVSELREWYIKLGGKGWE